MSWSDVESLPEFQALPADRKARAKSNYFNKYIAPKVPSSDLEGVKQTFLGGQRFTDNDKATNDGIASIGGILHRAATTMPEFGLLRDRMAQGVKGAIGGVALAAGLRPYETAPLEIPGVQMAAKAIEESAGGIASETATTLARQGHPNLAVPVGVAASIARGPGLIDIAISKETSKRPTTLGDIAMMYASGKLIDAISAIPSPSIPPLRYLYNNIKYKMGLATQTAMVPVEDIALKQAVSEGRIRGLTPPKLLERSPITPEETAETILKAEDLHPGASNTAQVAPRTFTAATSISDVPASASTRLGAFQGSVNQILKLPPGTPVTPETYHKAMQTGKLSRIEALEIDEQIFKAEATNEGIPPEAQAELLRHSQVAAQKPIEFKVMKDLADTVKNELAPQSQPSPTAKPPEFHEMTKEAFQAEAAQLSGGSVSPELASQVHQDIVGQAIVEGKTVPGQSLAPSPAEPQASSVPSGKPEPQVTSPTPPKSNLFQRAYPYSESIGGKRFTVKTEAQDLALEEAKQFGGDPKDKAFLQQRAMVYHDEGKNAMFEATFGDKIGLTPDQISAAREKGKEALYKMYLLKTGEAPPGESTPQWVQEARQKANPKWTPERGGWTMEKGERPGIQLSREDDIVVKTASGKFKAYKEENLIGEYATVEEAARSIEGIDEEETELQALREKEVMGMASPTPARDMARKYGLSKSGLEKGGYEGEAANLKGLGIIKAKGGMTPDELAEKMAEAKIIPEHDLNMMWDILDKESRLGPKSHITSTTGTSGTQSLAARGAFATGIPPEEARIEALKPVQSPELFKLARQLIGKLPSISGRLKAQGLFTERGGVPDIKLRRDLAENTEQALKTLAHEIGHAWKWLAEQKNDLRTIPGRLFTMQRFIKDMPSFETPSIRQEFLKFSEYWRPYDKANADLKTIQYRNSADEIISDAMSALLTSPGELQRIAPQVFSSIMDNVDLSTQFHKAFMDLQGILNGDSEDVLAMRDKDVEEMFKSGRAIVDEAMTKRATSNGNFLARFMQQYDNKYYPWIKAQADAKRAGVEVPIDKDLKHIFELSEYRNRKNILLAQDIRDKVMAPLQAFDLGEVDLGKYMLFRWISEGRRVVEQITDSTSNDVYEFERTIFNPLGHTPQTANQGLAFMQRALGPEKFKAITDASNTLHDLGFETIKRMHDAGMISDEMFPQLEKNQRNYATFAVQKYLQDNPSISASIKAMKGTVQEVENPFVAYVSKIMAQNQAIEAQVAKKAAVDFIKKVEGAITPTKVVNQREMVAHGMGQLKLYENGKYVSYDVDPYMAESFERMDPRKLNVAISVLNKFQSGIFKPLVTSFNLGFVYVSSPIRYTLRTLELNPELPILEYLKTRQGFGKQEALAYAHGNPSEFVRAMIDSGELDPFIKRHEIEDLVSQPDQIDQILSKYGGLKKGEKPANLLMRILNPIAEHMRTSLEVSTTSHKIAAKKIMLEQGRQEGKELSYQIRHYAGMPSTKMRGTQYQTAESVFTFSNILKEHYRTSYQRAADPKTAPGFWLRSAMFTIIPTLLMRAAKEGAFGKDVKEEYDRVTDYDMMKYLVLPLGKVPGGEWAFKTLYARVPVSDIDSIIKPLVWKLTDPKLYEGKKDPVTDLMQPILADLPSFNPLIKMGYAYATFLTGNPPYDFYRSRPIISKQVMDRPGLEKYEKMIEWSLSNTGFADFSTYDPADRSTLEIGMQMTPILNRVLKISDYGKTQELREAIENTPYSAEIYDLNQKKKSGKISREDLMRLHVLQFQAKQYRRQQKQQIGTPQKKRLEITP